MAYGIIKVDNITFDNGGSDQNVTVSGLYRATTSGVTVSGTIAAGTVSGVTVIGSTTVSGATVTGTTANFTSGNFSNLISAAATMSGALIMANQQQVQFREAVGNGVNHIALQAPAIVSADQTITLPDETGTVVTTGDNGSVTSTMILDGTILNADINASAAIADTKLATISTAGKVSGTAITSGTIDTSGELQITNASPYCPPHGE
jgi:trimeric autotransporter adhesin